MQLTTVEAAARLGVTDRQVRRLVERGALPATRVAGRLVLDSADVERRATSTPDRGRPFAARAAWGVLWELSGERPSWLGSSERSRLRAWLRRATPQTLALATRARAHAEAYRVLPRYLDELTDTDDAVRAGVSAATASGADIVSVGTVELYCSETTRDRLVTEYALSVRGEPNIVLRIPHLEFTLLADGRTTMPDGVVAMDLLSSDDVRTSRAGKQIADELLRRQR